MIADVIQYGLMAVGCVFALGAVISICWLVVLALDTFARRIGL